MLNLRKLSNSRPQLSLQGCCLQSPPAFLHMTFQICLPPALASISILKFIFVTQMTKILTICQPIFVFKKYYKTLKTFLWTSTLFSPKQWRLFFFCDLFPSFSWFDLKLDARCGGRKLFCSDWGLGTFISCWSSPDLQDERNHFQEKILQIWKVLTIQQYLSGFANATIPSRAKKAYSLLW